MAEETVTTSDTPNDTAQAPVTGSDDLATALEKGFAETAAAEPPGQEETPPEKAEAAPTAPDIWKDFDPDKIPPEALNKLYKKFQPNLSERAEKIQTQQAQILENLVRRMEEKSNTPAPPSIREQIKSALDEGNYETALELANQPVSQRLQAIEATMAMNNAVMAARQADPTIVENEAAIAEVLVSDPRLQRLAAENGFANASLVLQGINAQVMARKMKAELDAQKTTIEARVKEGVEKALAERRAEIVKQGTGMTSAGRTSGTNVSTGNMSLKEAMEAAYAEATGS